MKAPMLACSTNVEEKDLEEILGEHRILYATDKYDGIRCVIETEGEEKKGLSRKGLQLPNAIIQDWIADCKSVVENMDGEIIIPGRPFNRIESWVMSKFTAPAPFKYVVFDYRTPRSNTPYLQRLQMLKQHYRWHDRILWLLAPTPCKTPEDIKERFKLAIERGHEGLILRTGDGPYKHGRATWNEGYEFKMKQFEDFEAVILGILEANENINEAELDKFGFTKRSKKKAGMRGKGTLGALICRDVLTGVVFKLGSGWDQELAQEIWDNQEDWLAQIVTYRAHTHGKKSKPRNASFKGKRRD